MNDFFVYILRCCDDTLYTGYTNDMDARFKVHSSGKGAKYTRGRLPVTLVFFQTFPYKSSAMKREAQIKRLTRTEKLSLIASTGDADSQEPYR